MKLTAKNVHDIFMDCLFKDTPKSGTKYLPAEGLTTNVGFNTDKINKYANDIKSLLNELPETFRETVGGGWSFLEAYLYKDGNHWGEHTNMQELLLLGIASGYAKYLLPRELWTVLPGGVPYFVVLDDRQTVEEKVA